MAENKGHVHAALMMQYAQQALETDQPWKLWEFRQKEDVRKNNKWQQFCFSFGFDEDMEYRLKIPTKKYILELPEPMKEMPFHGQIYWHINYYNMVCNTTCNSKQFDFDMFEKGLCFATEADAQEFLDVLKNRQPATE